ncbi:hypothetical protein [Polaromonas hydrogenivorans]|uniref:Uncharacterized protein n=1 Tax=Polaromonas hydrogenivorans TaxID=335476 RepID=A0AAU7M093_9BURK
MQTIHQRIQKTAKRPGRKKNNICTFGIAQRVQSQSHWKKHHGHIKLRTYSTHKAVNEKISSPSRSGIDIDSYTS